MAIVQRRGNWDECLESWLGHEDAPQNEEPILLPPRLWRTRSLRAWPILPRRRERPRNLRIMLPETNEHWASRSQERSATIAPRIPRRLARQIPIQAVPDISDRASAERTEGRPA